MGALISLTILNTIIILYFIFEVKMKFFIEIFKDTTFLNNTLVGYNIKLCKKTDYGAMNIYSLNIHFRNKKKLETKEQIWRLINDKVQNRIYTLNSIFSWLKTIEEVNQFKKDYSIVDEEEVKKLVDGFKLKSNIEDKIIY